MAAASASTPAGSCSSPTPNVPNASNVDNTDLRPYTTTFDLFGNELRVGTTINNNPTVQDPYNSSFAWGYPYIASQLAPTPAASPILASGFNNNSIGYTVYAWYDRHLYLEAGAYSTLSTWALARIGNDFGVGSSQGAMPYLRAAYEWDWNQQAFHIGTIYMQSNVNPVSGVFQTDGSLGRDHFTDYVIDAGYQWLGDGNHIVTILGTFTHEDQNLEGTTAGYNAANGTTFGPKSNFNQIQFNASYWYQNTYGLTLAWQNTWGPANPQLYTTGSDMTNSFNGKPNSNAFIIEADWVPFGKAELMAAPVGQPETGHPVHPVYPVQRRHQELRRLRPQRRRQQHAVPVRLDGVLGQPRRPRPQPDHRHQQIERRRGDAHQPRHLERHRVERVDLHRPAGLQVL